MFKRNRARTLGTYRRPTRVQREFHRFRFEQFRMPYVRRYVFQAALGRPKSCSSAVRLQPGDAWHSVDASRSPQAERSSAEKAPIVKGKQPDRRPRKDKRSHKPEASSDIVAQSFLSFLMQNVHTAQQTGAGAEAQIAGTAI